MVDCGAGIGRVTHGLLCGLAEVVDIVEPVEKFTVEIAESDQFAEARSQGKIGHMFNVGLEAWEPVERYDIIWNQWCLGHLDDDQLENYLARCREWLTEDGVIIVKENDSATSAYTDVFDEVDSSVIRTRESFQRIFHRANLRVIAAERQTGMPSELYDIVMFALRPQV